MNISKIQEELQQLVPEGVVKSNEVLKEHVYTKMGGKADILAAPATYEEIQKLLHMLKRMGLRLRFLVTVQM